MKFLKYVLIGSAIYLGLTATAWSSASCSEDGLKGHACRMIQAEGEMVDSAADMVGEACKDKEGKKSCEKAMKRLGDLDTDIQDMHDENEALQETDYTEMIGASYKGRGRVRDDGKKSCQAKNVDADDLAEFLADMEVMDHDEDCEDCLVYFNSRDQSKAEDDKCNSWKVRILDENGDKDGTIHISEKQEQLCPTQCKGKANLEEDKKNRFKADVNVSITELEDATLEMQNESVRISSARVTATGVAADSGESDDCDAMGTTQPISAGVIAAAFTVANVLEWGDGICEPPADQTVAGFNASAVCLVTATASMAAKEVHDVLALFNDEFQGEQISHIQECTELLSTKVDDLGDQLDDIQSTVNDIRNLVITPQGKRETEEGDSWPNKDQ